MQSIVGLGVVSLLLVHALGSAGGAESLLDRLGMRAALVLVPIQALASFMPVSGETLAVANGALFGFWPGSLLSWGAWMLTSWLQYGVIRRTARDFDLDAHLGRLPDWLRRLPVDHPVFLIGVRIPFGGPIVNTAAGAFGVPLWRHSWCAAIGIAPRAMFFAGVGVGILQL
jgi:uncharacterized membrane protein YdjX (TVP38/TMEM64 family)